MITVEDFKKYFNRDFPFLPTWVEGKMYNINDVVYYDNNFYISLSDFNIDVPANAEHWERTQADYFDYISDEDVEKAIEQASVLIPYQKIRDERTLRLCELWLTAHCLVHDIRTSNSGLGSRYDFPLQSKSVGSISQSYGIPRRFLDSEAFSFYITSGYGMKYLALALPYCIGTVRVAFGRTTP